MFKIAIFATYASSVEDCPTLEVAVSRARQELMYKQRPAHAHIIDRSTGLVVKTLSLRLDGTIGEGDPPQ